MNISGYEINPTEAQMHGIMILLITGIFTGIGFAALVLTDFGYWIEIGLYILTPVVSLIIAGKLWNTVYNGVITNGD